jgi:hypothetical protein
MQAVCSRSRPRRRLTNTLGKLARCLRRGQDSRIIRRFITQSRFNLQAGDRRAAVGRIESVKQSDDRYPEARGFIEDLTAAWPGDPASELLAAAQRYLQTHCQQCGRALVGAARAGRRDLPDSQPDALATRRPAPAMLQPPSTPPHPTPTTASAAAPESFDAVRHRWPERSQPSAQACWDAPTIQALRQYSATAYPRSRFAAASTERLDSVNTPSAPRSSSNSWSRPPAPISAYERWPLCYSAPPLARPRTPSRELSTTAIQPHGKNASNSPPPAHVVEAMIS